MQTHFVRVKCDVTAKVRHQPLRYRAYVNNELFAERTWIWENCYLEESFQIQAVPGVYPIRFETVDSDHGRIKVRNYRTDVDIMQDQIQQLQSQLSELKIQNIDKDGIKSVEQQIQLSELKIQNIDKDGIKSVEQQIQTLDNALQLCLKNRTVKIITYQGQRAVEISDAST